MSLSAEGLGSFGEAVLEEVSVEEKQQFRIRIGDGGVVDYGGPLYLQQGRIGGLLGLYE